MVRVGEILQHDRADQPDFLIYGLAGDIDGEPSR